MPPAPKLQVFLLSWSNFYWSLTPLFFQLLVIKTADNMKRILAESIRVELHMNFAVMTSLLSDVYFLYHTIVLCQHPI